jgi:hypothetical protein
MKAKCFKSTIVGILWVGGLLLAGSDGESLPWSNLWGLLVFGVANWLLTRKSVPLDFTFVRVRLIRIIEQLRLFLSGGEAFALGRDVKRREF